MQSFISLFKTISFFFMLALLTACGAEGENTTTTPTDNEVAELGTEPSAKAEQIIQGQWKLVNFESNGSTEKYKECDIRTIWNFTSEDDGALDDGTKTKKMVATAPEDCKYHGFEAKWANLPDGQLFISTTKVGGMGGASNAGLFKVEELTEDKMVLKALSNIYTFQR